MAGDAIGAAADYYYRANNYSSHPPLLNVIGSILSALSGTGAAGALKGSATAITNQLQLDPNMTTIVNNPNDGGNLPKAYLQY